MNKDTADHLDLKLKMSGKLNLANKIGDDSICLQLYLAQLSKESSMQLWHSECIFTFRVLDFPDLTVDGSFVTGAAIAATMIVLGYHPVLATVVAIVVGFIAGCMTGLLHTKGKINPLLAGILMMIALYSINLRIMGLTSKILLVRPNIPLLNAETMFSQFYAFWSTLGIDETINQFFSMLGVTVFAIYMGNIIY